MRTKYNWQQLKAEFIQGSWLTIADFLRAKSIPNNSRTRINTRGWSLEKREVDNKVIVKAQEEYIVSESDIRLRQARTGRLMQYRAIRELEGVDLRSSEDVRKMLVSGMEQERSAVGITGKDANLTQVNINVGAKTNLDNMIEEMSYVELLELIGELKKQKEERNVTE